MKFIDLINKRYSVRAYQTKTVEDKKLAYVLEAARLAPTASNRQPFQIIVIHTEGKKEDLLSIYPREWFANAPLVLCVCGISSLAWTRRDNKRYMEVDAALVMDYLVLAATEIGLGTCFIAAFNEENARSVLALPDDVQPILFTPLGYPNDTPKIKERKSVEDLVRYEKW
jgi:nitroreductase